MMMLTGAWNDNEDYVSATAAMSPLDWCNRYNVTFLPMQHHGPVPERVRIMIAAMDLSCWRADAAVVMAPMLNTRSAQCVPHHRFLLPSPP